MIKKKKIPPKAENHRILNSCSRVSRGFLLNLAEYPIAFQGWG